jgi:capsular polysaccharide biosynthesis protein
VEANEAVQRILRAHWKLITVAVILGLGAALFITRGETTMYAGTARVALGTKTPQSEAEAAALESGARGIVTSRARVAAALRSAKVLRNAQEVADKNVSLRVLGTSNIVQLSVKDENPQDARLLTNSLAEELQQTWVAIARGQSPEVQAGLDRRLSDMTEQIASLDAQIDAAGVPVRNTDPVRTLLARREDLSRQAASLQAQRDKVLSDQAVNAQASIISSASTPKHSEASGRSQELALGALLGLVVGVGLAAVVETVRPTLLGSRRVAQALGVAQLGRLARPPSEATPDAADVREVGTRIRLAASAADVNAVELVAAPPVDLRHLSVSLKACSPTTTAVEVAGANGQTAPASGELLADGAGHEAADGDILGQPAGHRGAQRGVSGTRVAMKAPERTTPVMPDLRVFGGIDGAASTASVGMVIVAPSRTTRDALQVLDDVRALTRSRVIGVVTYDREGVMSRLGRVWQSLRHASKGWRRSERSQDRGE